MTPLELAEIIDGNPDDEWMPDDEDEYRLWLEARDDECADENGVPW